MHYYFSLCSIFILSVLYGYEGIEKIYKEEVHDVEFVFDKIWYAFPCNLLGRLMSFPDVIEQIRCWCFCADLIDPLAVSCEIDFIAGFSWCISLHVNNFKLRLDSLFYSFYYLLVSFQNIEVSIKGRRTPEKNNHTSRQRTTMSKGIAYNL